MLFKPNIVKCIVQASLCQMHCSWPPRLSVFTSTWRMLMLASCSIMQANFWDLGMGRVRTLLDVQESRLPNCQPRGSLDMLRLYKHLLLLRHAPFF